MHRSEPLTWTSPTSGVAHRDTAQRSTTRDWCSETTIAGFAFRHGSQGQEDDHAGTIQGGLSCCVSSHLLPPSWRRSLSRTSRPRVDPAASVAAAEATGLAVEGLAVAAAGLAVEWPWVAAECAASAAPVSAGRAPSAAFAA